MRRLCRVSLCVLTCTAACVAAGTDLEPILDRKAQVSAPDVTFHALVGKAMMRNESIVLDPQLTAWQGRVHSEACQPKCTFTLSLTIHVPSDQVPYVPTFVEVAKFSWVQFITTGASPPATNLHAFYVMASARVLPASARP